MGALAAACAAAITMSASSAQAGSPDHQVVSGVWTVTNTTPRWVDGTLSFADGARVAIAKESQFATSASNGVAIAVATCGIEGTPSITNYNFGLKMSGRIDLRGGSRQVANLVGAPDVTHAQTFGVTGVWTVEEPVEMTVDGTLSFTSGARVVIADESLFSSIGREGVVIATAVGGITGVPRIENYDFALKLSADGKSLIVYDNIPDVANWSTFSRKITVAFTGAQSDATLTNFPVLVRMSPAIDGFSYADFKRENCADLRFADSDGNVIPHEVDTWNTNGESTVWVRVPRLNAATTITAYYGSLHPVRAKDAAEVWSNGYAGVWHLGAAADATVQPDSSTNCFDFTDAPTYPGGMVNDVGGIVGKAVTGGGRSDGKGQYQYSDSDGRLDGFAAITVEAWTYQDHHDPGTADPFGVIVKKYNGSQAQAFSLMEQKLGTGSYPFAFYIDNVTNRVYSPIPQRAVWNHVVGVWNGTSGYRNDYVNGTPQLSETNRSDLCVGKLNKVGGTLILGNNWQGGVEQFKGVIDEVRISSVARSGAWIKASHDTVANPNFATYTVETIEPAAVAYAKEVNVAFTGYSGTALANFPVLVKLSQSIPGFRYADFTLPNGGDLRFFDAGGNLLAHEIDTWNPNGVSTVWVKVPTLSASTSIKAKYGCDGTPPDVSAKDVWDDDYVGVWHLGESGVPMKESSETSSDFTRAYGSTIGYAADGIVGKSVDFSANGQNNSLVANDHDALDGFSKFTVEAWTFQTAHKSNAGVLSKRSGNTSEVAYCLYSINERMVLTVPPNKNSAGEWTYHFAPDLGEWNHFAYTVDMISTNKNVHGVKNGVSSTWYNSKNLRGPMANCASDLVLGNMYVGATNSFNGKIDEVRISKTIRSDAWLKATYDTIANPYFATYSMDGYEPQVIFAKEVSVAFGGVQSGVTLTNFPVLVRLSENIPGFRYADFSQTNGGDLRFFNADCNLLSHEIDTWNPNGVSTVWVKVPTLNASTTITAKYGCSNPQTVSAKDVWDDDYVGVWHLGESGVPMKESSETSSDFASSYGKTIGYGADGIVGKSVNFPSGGISNALVAADHDALDGFSKFTIEAWTFQDEHKSNAGVLSKRSSNTNEVAYYLFDALPNNSYPTMAFCVGTNRNTGTDWTYHAHQTFGAWNHLAYTVDMTKSTYNTCGYNNGSTAGTWSKKYPSMMPNCKSDLILGNLGANNAGNAFNGRIDEVRISKAIRSADWIVATYETVMKPDFATYSTVNGTLSGYAAWMNARELSGAFDETAAKGIPNGIRYAFDIDPEKGAAEIGEPIIKVAFDADGNPVVEARNLADGREDVTFGILATPDISDWSDSVLVPMEKFGDEFWKPSESRSSGYVFPPQLFFKYKIEVQ